MKKLKLIFFLLISFFCQIGISQINPELIVKSRNKYYHQGKIYYSKIKLKKIYESNPRANETHQYFIKKRRKHRILTGFSTSAIIGRLRWNKKTPRCRRDYFCHDPDWVKQIGKDLVTILILSGSASVIIGSALPVYSTRGEAFRIYNEEVLTSKKVGATSPNINIGTTNNGVGLVLNF